ncbi:hypothetical protein ACFQ3W_06055 [Paenibacillus puldeungensis]|uniref:Uncharacterized protein n=1 Tax=Paenibacillus puldeungensis TaxID=696536 RepID=A0ABW3RU81_9BACL
MRLDACLEEELELLKLESEKLEEWIDFAIFAPEKLEKAQAGYSVDPAGRSLITGEEGDWQPEWIVIGYTKLIGDPIIIDTNEEGQPVSYLMHGMGEWGAGSYIAGSIKQLRDALAKVMKFMKSHLEHSNSPITRAELNILVSDIVGADEYADSDTWEMLLEPIYQLAEDQEERVTEQIRAMSEQGLQIKEIADRLEIPLTQVYDYLKKIKTSQI